MGDCVTPPPPPPRPAVGVPKGEEVVLGVGARGVAEVQGVCVGLWEVETVGAAGVRVGTGTEGLAVEECVEEAVSV